MSLSLDDNLDLTYDDLKFHRDFRGVIYDTCHAFDDVNIFEKKMRELLERKKMIDNKLYTYLTQKNILFLIFKEIDFVVSLSKESKKVEVFAYNFEFQTEDELARFILNYLTLTNALNIPKIINQNYKNNYEIICK